MFAAAFEMSECLQNSGTNRADVSGTTYTWEGVTWFPAALSPYQSRARPRAVRTGEGRKGTVRLVSVSGLVCRPPPASYVMKKGWINYTSPLILRVFAWTWFSLKFHLFMFLVKTNKIPKFRVLLRWHTCLPLSTISLLLKTLRFGSCLCSHQQGKERN